MPKLLDRVGLGLAVGKGRLLANVEVQLSQLLVKGGGRGLVGWVTE